MTEEEVVAEFKSDAPNCIWGLEKFQEWLVEQIKDAYQAGYDAGYEQGGYEEEGPL